MIKPISLVLTFLLIRLSGIPVLLILLLNPSLTPIPLIIISARKVCRVLSSFKTDETSGPDDIPSRFLKEAADELVPVLCRLFRPILISCVSQYL